MKLVLDLRISQKPISERKSSSLVNLLAYVLFFLKKIDLNMLGQILIQEELGTSRKKILPNYFVISQVDSSSEYTMTLLVSRISSELEENRKVQRRLQLHLLQLVPNHLAAINQVLKVTIKITTMAMTAISMSMLLTDCSVK